MGVVLDLIGAALEMVGLESYKASDHVSGFSKESLRLGNGFATLSTLH